VELWYVLLSKNQQVKSAFTIDINPTVRTVEVVRYANTREKEVHAKTVEVVVYANTRE